MRTQDRNGLPLYLVEYLPGLRRFAVAELKSIAGKSFELIGRPNEDEALFRYAGDPRELTRLRVSSSVSLVLKFDVPRPKALLGDVHFGQLQAGIEKALPLAPKVTTFRIRAAGAESAVLSRLAEQIAATTKLKLDQDEGEFVIRLFQYEDGWLVLFRLGARPLSTRSWRAIDYPGALNGCIAAAMIRLSQSTPEDRVLNPMCGSGTLLIERAAAGASKALVGFDHNSEALAAASVNITAARTKRPPIIFRADARKTPLATGSFSSALVDLPWGERIGDASTFDDLYGKTLDELRRVISSGGRCILITQAKDILKEVVERRKSDWGLLEAFTVFQGGFHPEIFALERLGRTKPKK